MIRLDSPAAGRNAQPILDKLTDLLPSQAMILELASGPGVHAALYVAACPGWTIQPSDPSPAALASIASHRDAAPNPRLLSPLALDVTRTPWLVQGPYDGVLAINLIHIAPIEAALCVMAQTYKVLKPGAALLLYGPFSFAGQTAPSNRAFDRGLRAQDPRWGLRDVEDLKAMSRGLVFQEAHVLPANNHLLEFRRPLRPA